MPHGPLGTTGTAAANANGGGPTAPVLQGVGCVGRGGGGGGRASVVLHYRWLTDLSARTPRAPPDLSEVLSKVCVRSRSEGCQASPLAHGAHGRSN